MYEVQANDTELLDYTMGFEDDDDDDNVVDIMTVMYFLGCPDFEHRHRLQRIGK